MTDPTQNQDTTIGTPETDAATFDGQQSYDDTCAIRSQEFILEQFTGQEVDEAALVQEAEDMGWYTEGQGTSPEDMGNLLELHGIPVNQYENATTYDLANELAQGHKVMISVDSGELWGEENPDMEDMATGMDGADHAVVVSGIDASDPNNPQVIVSDPGTGEPAATYPLDQFVSAWQDSNFQMVSTQDPAPASVAGMENFDYEAGHIPEVAGMPYDDFVETYEQDPAAFDEVIYDDVTMEGAEPDPVDTEQEANEVIEEADALIEQNDALLDDLQDGQLDTYGQ